MRKIALIIVLAILISIFGYFLYKFLFTPRLIFGAKGFTEYSPGSPGKVFIQVLDNYYTPVNNAVCKLTIYNPDGSYFAKDQLMAFLENGLYYFDFVAPYVEGVYMTTVECFYPSHSQVFTPDDSKLWYRDGSVINKDETIQTFPYINTSGNIELLAMFTAIDTPVYIWLNDTATNSWVLVATATKNTPQVSVVVDLSIYNPPGVLINSTRSFSLDLLNIIAYFPQTRVITELRGGGEIHVETKKAHMIPDEETPYIKTIS